MRSNDEPLAITPSSPTVEPLQFPIATADQGREMENIWQMVNMVTPTTGTNSQSLKKYWQEFVSRFRHFELPLDESRALMVIFATSHCNTSQKGTAPRRYSTCFWMNGHFRFGRWNFQLMELAFSFEHMPCAVCAQMYGHSR